MTYCQHGPVPHGNLRPTEMTQQQRSGIVPGLKSLCACPPPADVVPQLPAGQESGRLFIADPSLPITALEVTIACI